MGQTNFGKMQYKELAGALYISFLENKPSWSKFLGQGENESPLKLNMEA
jgi:hypothetical protein